MAPVIERSEVCTCFAAEGEFDSCSRPNGTLHAANMSAFSPWPCHGYEASLGNSVAVTGHPQPFRDFFGKVRNLQPVTILVLGGSIGACSHITPVDCWTVTVLEWFDIAFPGHNVVIKNAAVHSTTSTWASRCFTSLVCATP